MSNYQTISASLLALMPLIGALPQSAVAQSTDPVFTEPSIEFSIEPSIESTAPSAIEAAANSPQTVITTQGQHTHIEGGVTANSNLFHRFDTFTVEAGHTANFVTPDATQAVIGQVSGGSTSYIDGTLQVSGSDADLYLINPTGILFGPDAQLNLNGDLTATTADQIGFGDTWVDVATSQDYSQIAAEPSAYQFTTPTPGTVVNHADLAVADGNAVRFIGGEVINTGNIKAPAGEITLTALPGESLVRLASAGSLLNLEVDALPTSVTPLALPELLTGEASPNATELQLNDDGSVSLAGSVILTGELDVSSEAADGTGGEINVLGSTVETYGANLYADGAIGGGLIRVGGDYQGQGTTPTAEQVSFTGTAHANALTNGDGGEIILWSDGVTHFSGRLSANAAGEGQGGLVETSGKEQLTLGDSAQVTTDAPSGELGTWLLDPVDLTVIESNGNVSGSIIGGRNTDTDSQIEASVIETALNFNNITLQATNSITVNAAIDATRNANPGNLQLQTNSLNLNDQIELQGASQLTGTATQVQLGASGLLQNAVDAAATGGDINLAATTYQTGETFISRDITLQGQGVDSTIFDGENTSRLFNISSGTVAIDGVTIRNGNATDVGGGGILVAGSGSLALSNSLIENNNARTSTDQVGGGIYLIGTGVSTVDSSVFQDNYAEHFGGGLRTGSDHQITIEGSTFINNAAGLRGGGIDRDRDGGRFVLQNSTLINNTAAASGGGGISIGSSSHDFVIENTLFENNVANDGGGAIGSHTSPVIITDSTFRSNHSIDGSGGAITTRGSLTLLNSLLEDNTARNNGGAIELTEDKIGTILNTTLSRNIARVGSGGAITLEGQYQLNIGSSTLSNNSADGDGGAIHHNSTSATGLTIDTSTLSGNRATGRSSSGGALLVESGATASLIQSTVANNTASLLGGGIENSVGTLFLTNSLIANNTATTGNDISGTLNSGGHNLVSSRTGGFGYVSTDLPHGLNANIAALADNGGNTFTHALLSNSPARDAAAGTSGVDQRGAAANGRRDIGAYERLPISELQITAGNEQTTTVATAYANPIEVQAIDALGGALGGAPIGFLVNTNTPEAPNVAFTSSTGIMTNSEGLATVSLSANTVAGPVSLIATSQGVFTTATLTNLAAAADQLTIVQGDNQSTVVNTSFDDLVVKVSDRFGNNIDGARIDFSVPTTGATGVLSQAFNITGNSGEGRVGLTANTVAGTYDITATSEGLSTTATLTNLADAADNLTILQGDNQSTVVGTLFPEELSVQVSDRFGNGISGIAASFSSPQPNGSTATVALTTDSSGIFSTPIRANTITGSGSIEASAAGLTTNLTLTKLADVASRFVLGAYPTAVTAGDVNSFTVTAEDQFGNIADGYGGTVSITSSDTQAQLPENSLLTNGVGNFISELRTAGNQSLTVTDRINRIATTQSNIAVSPSEVASINILAGNQQQSTVDTSFTQALTVEVHDRFGNPLIGETINFVAPTSGASATLDSPSVILDSLGQATTSLSANTQTGSYLINAVIDGLSTAFTLENTFPNSVATTPVIEEDIPAEQLDPFLENGDEEGEGGGRGDLFDEYAFSQLEQSLSEEYATYWQRPIKRGATLENIQQVLQQAGDEYKSRSAIVYAVFVPPNGTTDDETDMAYSSLLSRRLLTNDVNNAQDELLLLLIPPEGNPIPQRIAISRRQLQRQAQLFNIELSSFFGEGYQPLAQQLYSWLLAPIENDLQSAGIDNLMYVLDEGLSTVPLAAMMTDDTFAIERYGLSVLPSVGLLQTDFGEDPADHTVLAGGSETFAELEALPAVPIELDIIKSTATSSQVLLNEDFSIENLRQAHAQAPKSMMHVATHAAFNPGSADRSYVQFWEEQLKLEDIADLGLEDLELLILSACTTALGSRDAELGFAGLAAATGVEASIGSLWNVSDLGTMALMAEFYEQIQNSPLRFSALQQAQLALLNGETYIENNHLITQNSSVSIPPALVEQDIDFRHPFFWSGFTLVGNPWW